MKRVSPVLLFRLGGHNAWCLTFTQHSGSNWLTYRRNGDPLTICEALDALCVLLRRPWDQPAMAWSLCIPIHDQSLRLRFLSSLAAAICLCRSAPLGQTYADVATSFRLLEATYCARGDERDKA